MNNQRQFRAGLALLLALAVPGGQAAQAAEAAGSKAVCSAAVDVGAQYLDRKGSKEKLNEYRDLRDGLQLNEARLSVYGTEEPFFLDVEARNAARGWFTPESRDSHYRMEAGRYGAIKVSGSYDRMPHNFAQGQLILGGAGTDNQSIAASVQAANDAVRQTRAQRGGVALTDTNGNDALLQANIRALINAADPLSFHLDREKVTGAGEFSLGKDAKAWVKYSGEDRTGFRQIGMGAYERYAQGAAGIAHTEDQFVVAGNELAEPISYRTQSLNLGVGRYTKAWSADIEYTYSEFYDRYSRMVWANPLTSVDRTARNATDTAANNAYDRGQFIRGQAALPPTSRTNELAASGSVELPLKSRLTGSVGLALTEANSTLIPYTLNSALSGVSGAPANITNPSSLPIDHFKGAVRNLTASLALTSKPVDKLATALKLRYYGYANRSDRIDFPGYAAFGESLWRANKNDFFALVSNDKTSYARKTAEVSAAYEVSAPLKVDVKADWDHWSYSEARIDATNEYGVQTGFSYRAGKTAKLHGNYRFARRTVKGYTDGFQLENPEAPGQQNFNWADRVLHKADAGVGLEPLENLSFDVDGSYRYEFFGSSNRFGLKQRKAAAATVSATYEPSEKVSLSADYSREHSYGKMQSAAKDDANANWSTDNYAPFNYWNASITEDVDTVDLQATVRPEEKLECSIGFGYSRSDMGFNVTNPNAAGAAAIGFGNGTKFANGRAQVWPNVRSTLQELRLAAAYQLLKDLRVGANYLYSKYSLDDFANTGAYLPGASPENSTRYVFTGGTQFDYTSHVIGTYLAYKF